MMKFGIVIAAMAALAAAPVGAQAADWISAGANSGITSVQGTQSGVESSGNGTAYMGTVGGNYTSIQSAAQAGSAGTLSNTTQSNIGSNVSSGQTTGHGMGVTSGTQESEVSGASHATLQLGGATHR